MTWVYSVSSRAVDLHRQQLRRAADAAQRVLDLVRQVADQLLVGLRLVDQALFAVLARLLGPLTASSTCRTRSGDAGDHRRAQLRVTSSSSASM
jgi:hypothetical protein